MFLFQHQLIGKIEKIKTTKDSPAQKPELEKTEKTKQSDGMHDTTLFNGVACKRIALST